ncbi:hypothetical protein [Kitasatospora sp. NPDC050543]|uniref:hypothetical protein n=1 Tax=Kitasatospora sp. NPDC050543 TaxID=3364054 RepID=UPI0037AC04D0
MEELRDARTVAGFVFVTDRSPDYLKAAAAGMRVTVPLSEPSRIVVDHAPERVVVARWPGRLFRAQVATPATDEEHAAMASDNPRPDIGYTRAVAVDLQEEISPSALFGPHGDAVVRVIEAAVALDERGARNLASATHPAAGREYSNAWHQWLSEPGHLARDHASTLMAPRRGRPGSPIGYGFAVAWDMVRKSAELRGGEEAFAVDKNNDEILSDPWRTAGGALLHAAMAFGAPHLADSHAIAMLTTAWNTVFEPAASGPSGDTGPQNCP